MPPLGHPRGVLGPNVFGFGGFIKCASRSQKVDFRSDEEGVQIEERNPADRIYKTAATRKAVLLQCVSSPSREFSSLIFWWEVLHTPENMAQISSIKACVTWRENEMPEGEDLQRLKF